ncbi:MAG: hypothetical protein J4400_00875 [Candidatus Aenigmarchaeota archaeon]|nr:hypothetical protein [Candidatus Aenigmarchaeota archaeon]
MPELDPIAKARSDAMMSIRRPENLQRLRDYARPEMGIAVYGVYPAGVGPANIIGAYFTGIGRDITSHTYRPGDRFNKGDVKGRRVLAVKDSAYTNGIRQIGEAAQGAIDKAYIGPDDFRLLIADTFTLLTVDEIRGSFKESHDTADTQLEETDRS